jgi:hypothetical protein
MTGSRMIAAHSITNSNAIAAVKLAPLAAELRSLLQGT